MKKSLKQDALNFHATGRPGKLEITPTKPLTTQRDLSLAYSPGVAEPCLAIKVSPDKAYDYTAKGSIVAVISNEGDQPGVSGRNSLPLPGTRRQGLLLVSALFMPLDLCIEFYIDFKVDIGRYFGPKFTYFSMIF